MPDKITVHHVVKCQNQLCQHDRRRDLEKDLTDLFRAEKLSRIASLNRKRLQMLPVFLRMCRIAEIEKIAF